MDTFREKVLKYIQKIPKGKVVSYGQVAAAAGSPRAARQVGQVLRALDDVSTVPWWRVINSEGYLSIKGNWDATKETQKSLLEKEGIQVSEGFIVDLQTYRLKQ